MTETKSQKGKTLKRTNYRLRNRLIFYSLGIAIPVIQFCVFYIYVNFNSFLLAFQKYIPNKKGLGYTIEFAGFENFKSAFQILKENAFAIKNSLIFFVLSTLFELSLAIVFSFYISKKYYASGFFRVILFLPQIVSHVVFALLFNYLVSDVYPYVVELVTGHSAEGLFNNQAARFPTVLFFNLWMGFGVNVMLFSGAMSNINPSIIESAQIDGASLVQEFFHITIPMIFPTFITFIVVGLAGIFTDQMNLYSLFANDAGDLSTLGYFMYSATTNADVVVSAGYYSYSQLSALGLILTAIVFPVTWTVRKLLETYGPNPN